MRSSAVRPRWVASTRLLTFAPRLTVLSSTVSAAISTIIPMMIPTSSSGRVKPSSLRRSMRRRRVMSALRRRERRAAVRDAQRGCAGARRVVEGDVGRRRGLAPLGGGGGAEVVLRADLVRPEGKAGVVGDVAGGAAEVVRVLRDPAVGVRDRVLGRRPYGERGGHARGG